MKIFDSEAECSVVFSCELDHGHDNSHRASNANFEDIAYQIEWNENNNGNPSANP